MAWRIPFNRPMRAGAEHVYLERALASGYMAGDGTWTKLCEDVLAVLLGGARVLLTTSGTHALELAALLLDLNEGDEFCLPSFTFPSTANAFALRGARPVFCDIRPDTLNLDPKSLEARITERTRAVIPVHYGGIASDLGAILEIAGAHGATVVEDNAHGLFGRYQDRPLGSFGRLAAQSFHETKNVSCGEGGALVVNDPTLADRAEILREKGTDRSRFFRGEVDKYVWRDVGSSYVLSDVLAAWLFGQLEARGRIQAYRRKIWRRYAWHLADWAAAHDVQLPCVPPESEPAWHLFHIVLPTARAQQRLLRRLARKGILAVFHYQPLHLAPAGRRFGGRKGDCPVTESVAGRVVRLPFYAELSDAEQDEIIEVVTSFKP